LSRGHGRWQRAILDALDKHPAFHLPDLLPRRYSRAQYVALHRAAYTLHEQGKAEICHGQAASPWAASDVK
jgi:hypothetical protein